MSFASVFSRFRPVSTHRVLARTARPVGRPLAVFGMLILGSTTLLTNAARAQAPGTLDTAFLSAATETTIFAVNTAVVPTSTKNPTPVERVIAGGDETTLEVLDDTGTISEVLDDTGTLSTFVSPPFGGDSRRVYTIVNDPDVSDPTNPLFYFGGLFGNRTIDKVNRPSQNVVRVSTTGTLDSAFDPGLGADDYVTSILPLDGSDQGVMVAGLFLTFNKTNYPRLVRLLRSGAIDPNFPALAVDDGIFAMAAQIEPTLGTPDLLLPQFLIGGTFGNIGNTAYTKLARIDVNGGVDTSFRPVLDERVLAIATQPDGKIIVGGQFATINGKAAGHLARLNQDGSLDPAFNASVSVVPEGTSAPVAVYTLNLRPDGRIYVGGNFSAVDGVKREYLALLNPDGSLSTEFDPGSTITNSVQSVAVESDAVQSTADRVLVGETVSKKINNVFPPSLIRLYGVASNAASSVQIVADQPNAREGSSTTRQVGEFDLLRTSTDPDIALNDSTPLTVFFSVSGTASPGDAYKPLAVGHFSDFVDQLTFPAGINKLRVKVKPKNRVLSGTPETVTVSLLSSFNPDAFYNVVEPAASTVKIRNAP